MKRSVLGILLACLLLAGCGRADGPGESPAPTQSQPAPQESGPAQDTPQVTEPVRPGILDGAQAADGGLFYVPNAVIEENMMQELSVFQGQLLSACYIYDMQTQSDALHLRLIDLDSGGLLRETKIPTEVSYAVSVQVCGGSIAVSDGYSGIIRVLDGQLNETARYQVSGERIFVDEAVTTACCLSADGVRMVELAGGGERTVLSGAADLSVYACAGQDITVRYIDLTAPGQPERWAGIDLNTGAVQVLELEGSLAGVGYHGGVWAGEIPSDPGAFFWGTQAQPHRVRLEAEYPVLMLGGDPVRLVVRGTLADGAQTLAAYGADGSFLSACTVRDGALMLKQAWLDGAWGCFLIVIDSSGSDRLYFWDLTAPVQGEDLEPRPYEPAELTGTAVEPELYQRAAELSRQYGVRVRIAELCPVESGDKRVEQACDPAEVKAGLDALEQAMSAYPEGFFRQLRHGAYQTVEVCLGGEITNTQPVEGYAPTAFVRLENGVATMVLNIRMGREALIRNFYHETSHIIDKVLEHDAAYREGAVYSEEGWRALNPPEFAALNPDEGGYFGSYGMMPMEYFQEQFVSCFMSDYGKTFSTEDRATVFEAAAAGDGRSFQTSPVLREKLAFYCRCIRDCFDTEQWPERTAWEQTLDDLSD